MAEHELEDWEIEWALWSWEHPEAWDEAERNWQERNPKLRDDERL